MVLPAIAPFPPVSLRKDIVPEEWQACLDAWISLAEAHLRLSDEAFPTAVNDGSLAPFLLSYFRERSIGAPDESYLHGSKALELGRHCFRLSHRVLSGIAIPPELLNWTFLADLSYCFPRSQVLHNLLGNLWKRKSDVLEEGLQRLRSALTEALESGNPGLVDASLLSEGLPPQYNVLRQLGSLIHSLPAVGAFLMTGSDFLDSLIAAYSRAISSPRPKLVTIAYLGLVSLTRGNQPNYSLLSDHLYTLKTDAETLQRSNKSSLLSDLVTNTPLLAKVRDSAPQQEGARLRNLAASLSIFRSQAPARSKKLVRRKVDKGKGRVKDEYGHGAFGNVHVHRMSLISQIQDLFPDLGSGFVVKLLDEYGDNVEQVTAHLLDDSLPEHLKSADRSEEIQKSIASDGGDLAPHLAPRSTPPPQRRNVFDNDEFDQLTIDASRLHIGRKNEKLTADAILSDRSNAPNKAAILSALAAFDLDDDERDDTYDVEDVGGTVDSAVPGSDEADIDLRDKNEETLFSAYKMSPDAFRRDAATRRGKARLALKSETGMTDEAIEGWAIMVQRDPRRLKRLEAKFSTFSGQQLELASTAYRAGSGAEEDSDAGGAGSDARGRGGFRARGRGRGGGRGGRGGNVAGPSDDKGTQMSRQRKEANKGERANHNRREQRARKMARGGFPG